MSEERRQQILSAITAELARQAGQLDTVALAAAIDRALGADTLQADPHPADIAGPPGAGASPKGIYARVDEGRSPEQLNASNDDGRG